MYKNQWKGQGAERHESWAQMLISRHPHRHPQYQQPPPQLQPPPPLQEQYPALDVSGYATGNQGYARPPANAVVRYGYGGD